MDCNLFNEHIWEYLDGSISNEERIEFELHKDSCEKCKEKLLYTEDMMDSLNNIEEIIPPKGFNKEIINGIKKEKIKMTFKKIASYAAIFVLGIFITTMITKLPLGYNMASEEMPIMDDSNFSQNALGSEYATNESMDRDLGDEVQQKEIDGTEGDIQGDAEEGVAFDEVFDKEKIIYQGTVYLDVNDLNSSLSDIKEFVESSGGFIQNSYTNLDDTSEDGNAWASITVRVPAEKFNDVIDKMKDFGEETSTNVTSTNITTEYRNLQSELESLDIQEDRLIKYLEDAKDMEDLLTIENELSRVRTDINLLSTQLNNYNQRITYSNVSINIVERLTLTTEIKSPFGEMIDNIGKGFISSINLVLQFISFLIVLLFKIVPFLVLIIPAVFIIKKFILKK
ncbi:MAG: DUF4349 domain-containing protein [Eubacteriaceae bacterium]